LIEPFGCVGQGLNGKTQIRFGWDRGTHAMRWTWSSFTPPPLQYVWVMERKPIFGRCYGFMVGSLKMWWPLSSLSLQGKYGMLSKFFIMIDGSQRST
jgi:hypothetical protein